jgi:CubicO group peptidase (beta-lactamase class C family)
METEVRLKNGEGTKYGLGLDVTKQGGHRMLEHTGEVSGFTSDNIVYPDDKIAVAVLTNQDAASAASQIGRKIAPLLLSGEDAGALMKLKQVRTIFDGLQRGTIDRSLLTADANSYFSAQALKDFAASLGSLGSPEEFVQMNEEGRGGMTMLTYRLKFRQRTLDIVIYQMPDGKYEQYQVISRE